ncbi:MAG: AbrB/MazE/SpoVT family DNA-binding domain-containing protein [Pyrinomonadaceae bacterium]
MEITSNSKGQIVIPASIRHKFGIKRGTSIQIEVDEETNQITLKPITREYIHSLVGKFRGKGLLKSLALEKTRERKV